MSIATDVFVGGMIATSISYYYLFTPHLATIEDLSAIGAVVVIFTTVGMALIKIIDKLIDKADRKGHTGRLVNAEKRLEAMEDNVLAVKELLDKLASPRYNKASAQPCSNCGHLEPQEP